MFVNASRDGLSEAMWCFFGLAGGLFTTVTKNLYRAFVVDNPIPLSLSGAFELVLFFASLTAGVIILFVSTKRGKTAQDLATEIRNRRKS